MMRSVSDAQGVKMDSIDTLRIAFYTNTIALWFYIFMLRSDIADLKKKIENKRDES